MGDSGQNMATLNILVLGLCLSSGLKNLAGARRFFFDAFPANALSLLTSAKIPSLLKAWHRKSSELTMHKTQDIILFINDY